MNFSLLVFHIISIISTLVFVCVFHRVKKPATDEASLEVAHLVFLPLVNRMNNKVPIYQNDN